MANILYALLVFCIDIYKFIELRALSLIYPSLRKYVRYIFHRAGIRIDKKATGPFDIRIRESTDEKSLILRIGNNPSLGLGESYMEGLWDCDKLDELLYTIFKREVYKDYLNLINRSVNFLLFQVFNLQTKGRVWEVAEKHYDKGEI
jgi:cyclopropane-fatty-acyl-phospholipid synthase